MVDDKNKKLLLILIVDFFLLLPVLFYLIERKRRFESIITKLLIEETKVTITLFGYYGRPKTIHANTLRIVGKEEFRVFEYYDIYLVKVLSDYEHEGRKLYIVKDFFGNSDVSVFEEKFCG
jgi:hypothetical protein